jgi:membrane protease YdiL (CAAX protease family)
MAAHDRFLSSGQSEPAWPLWIAPAAVALGFVLGTMLAIVVAVIGHAGGSDLTHPGPAVNLISDVLFDAAFVAAAIYLAARTRRPAPADFGFRRVSPGLGVGAVLTAAIGYYALSAAYGSLVHISGKEKLPSELGISHSTAALVGATVFVCVIAPVAEEFFFRGFIFGVLRRMTVNLGGHDLGPWIAAAITGILFGLAHTGSASSQYLIPLGLLGFVLCLVRWRTGSLYPCMALHSLNNALALGVNQLNWSAGEILALMAGGLVVIGLITAPLSRGAPVAYSEAATPPA